MAPPIQIASLNHVAIVARDMAQSEEFYRDVLGCERIPAPNFGFPVCWLRLGSLQLHLQQPPAGVFSTVRSYHHFAVEVANFEVTYKKLLFRGAFEKGTYYSDVWVLPSGELQLFARDPSDNLFEIDCPDVREIDLSVIQMPVRYVGAEQTQSPANDRATLFLSHLSVGPQSTTTTSSSRPKLET
jgi:lactoylglutathione lyase